MRFADVAQAAARSNDVTEVGFYFSVFFTTILIGYFYLFIQVLIVDKYHSDIMEVLNYLSFIVQRIGHSRKMKSQEGLINFC